MQSNYGFQSSATSQCRTGATCKSMRRKGQLRDLQPLAFSRGVSAVVLELRSLSCSCRCMHSVESAVQNEPCKDQDAPRHEQYVCLNHPDSSQSYEDTAHQ